MLLVCGTRYQFCFVDIGNMPFFKDIWEQGNLASPPSYHQHLARQDGCDFGSGANVLSFLTLF
jgi:hypothetical protein